LLNPLLALFAITASRPPHDPLVLIGTFGPGIYSARLHADGSLSKPELSVKADGAGWLSKSPLFPVIYATINDKGQGMIASYKVDEATGKLTFVNEQPGGDCYISVSRDGHTIFTANYGEGSVASYPVLRDGSVGERTSFFQQEGSGPVPQQSGPHAHCINQDPSGKFVFVCDLGADKVFGYRFDMHTSTLTKADPPFTQSVVGDGPRHMVFDKAGRNLYVVNELGGSVTRFAYDRQTGMLDRKQDFRAVPDEFKGRDWAAEVALDRSGKHLYSSNRADDESITVFDVLPSGDLERKQVFHGDIHHPRHFTLDPSGKFLLIGNMEGKSVAICNINPKTGTLTPGAPSVEVPSPACILFLR
jgi:6-phosphogluconolactonase